MTYPHEPSSVPQRAGLGPAECVTCGAACLAAPGIEEPHCDPCRRIRIELLPPMPPGYGRPRPEVKRGHTWLPIGATHQEVVERHIAEPPVKVRILETAVITAEEDDRAPAAAKALAAKLYQAGRIVRLTYALAEDLVKAKPIHSLCVRVWAPLDPPVGAIMSERFGYAAYVDGRASSAVLWRVREGGPRKAHGIEEFTALALGRTWSPAPAPLVAKCPAIGCDKEVRWTKDGLPYKHKCVDDRLTHTP